MEMDDHDKHLLALIDARRPSSSSNKTRTTGGMSSRPKIKKNNKVTFSDPLTQHPQPTTESRTTFHEKDVFNVNHPSVVLDNATNFAAGTDHQGSHLNLAGEDTSKQQDTNSVSAAGGSTTYSHDVSTTRNSQRSWSIQQQSPKEIEVSSFSRFSGGQAGSKYDFRSVENLLKNDSSLTSTNSSTSISPPPPRIDITPPAVFLKNPQEEIRTRSNDEERTTSSGIMDDQRRDDDILPKYSQKQQHRQNEKNISTYPSTMGTISAISSQDSNFEDSASSHRIIFDDAASTTTRSNNNLYSRTVTRGGASSIKPSSSSSEATTAVASTVDKEHAEGQYYRTQNTSLLDPSGMQNLLKDLKTEILGTYRLTVTETSQTLHDQLSASISEENAINREQVLNAIERLDSVLKTMFNSIEQGNEQNRLEGKRLFTLQEELRHERNHLVSERNLIDQERRNVEDMKRELEQDSTRRNSYFERKEEELNNRCHDIEKERIDIENQKALLEKDKIEISELQEALKEEAKDLRDQRIRIDVEDANLNNERRKIQHIAEEVSYLSRKIALEKAAAEEELLKVRQIKEDTDALILGISEKQKELASGYDEIQRQEQALRQCKMDLARQRVDFLKERAHQRNAQQNHLFMM